MSNLAGIVSPMREQFIVKIQAQNRIVIPEAVAETMRLKKGDKIRVSVEKVR